MAESKQPVRAATREEKQAQEKQAKQQEERRAADARQEKQRENAEPVQPTPTPSEERQKDMTRPVVESMTTEEAQEEMAQYRDERSQDAKTFGASSEGVLQEAKSDADLDPTGTSGTTTSMQDEDEEVDQPRLIMSYNEIGMEGNPQDLTNKLEHPTPSARVTTPVVVGMPLPGERDSDKLKAAQEQIAQLQMIVAAAVAANGGILRIAGGDTRMLPPGTNVTMPAQFVPGEDFVITVHNEFIRPPGGAPAPVSNTYVIAHRVEDSLPQSQL